MKIRSFLSILLPIKLLLLTIGLKGQDVVICPDEIPGFQFFTEYNGHSYFISDDKEEWLNARSIAIGLGGYIVTINDEEENDHIHGLITEEIFIGLNDANEDDTYTWANGEELLYTNYDEDPSHPYTRMNSWNGKWGFEELFVARKYIVEFSCGDPIEPCNCAPEDEPVCGTDFEDYANPCEAECAQLFEYYHGRCDDLFGPDLEITGFRGLSGGSSLGSLVEYFFDLTNSGNRNAWDQYLIQVYLSPDSIYNNGNDAEVGIVNTGNTHIETIENVRGEIGIGDKVLPGENYLIMVVDLSLIHI